MVSLSSFLGMGTQSNLAPSGTVITQAKLADEIAPFWKDLLEKSQALYQSRIDKGYQPYQQSTMAELTPEQLQAMQGLRDLVGSQDAGFQRAQELTDRQSEKFTGDTAREYMSPYQQAVTDIEKRESQKVFERDIMPTFEKRAIDAGGMSGLGSRAGIEASQIGQAQMQQLGDIQTKGSQRAYDAAVRQFEMQKARERGEAQAQTQLGAQRYGAKVRELGGLSSVGETLQQREQTSLNEAYKRYLEEQKFEEDQLQRYQGTIQGFPDIRSQVRTTMSPQTSPFNKFLGQAAGLGSLYGSFGGFSPGGFGSQWSPFPGASGAKAAEGGQISRAGGGIASLPITYRQESGQVAGPTQRELLSRLNIPVEKFFEMSDPEKMQVLNTVNAPAQIQRALMGPYGTLARLPAAAYDVAAAPQKLAGQVIGYLGRTAGLRDPKSKDPLQTRLGSDSWTPAMDKIRKSLARRPVSMAELSTPSSVDAGLGGDVVDATFEKGSPQRQEPPQRTLDEYLKTFPEGYGGPGVISGEAWQAQPDPSRHTTEKERAKLSKIPEKTPIEKLQDMITAQAKEKKDALKKTKMTKSERSSKRREIARNMDLVETLARFSTNIDKPNVTIGGAFGKTTQEMMEGRRKELDRAEGVADEIDALDFKIATAESEGDLLGMKTLIEQQNKVRELNIKAADSYTKRMAARAKNAFEKLKINNDQAKQLNDLADLLTQGMQDAGYIDKAVSLILTDKDDIFKADVIKTLKLITGAEGGLTASAIPPRTTALGQ